MYGREWERLEIHVELDEYRKLERPEVKVRITLKQILKNWDIRVWTDSSLSERVPEARFVYSTE